MTSIHRLLLVGVSALTLAACIPSSMRNEELNLASRGGVLNNVQMLSDNGARCLLGDAQNFQKSPPTVGLYFLVGSSLLDAGVLRQPYRSYAPRIISGDAGYFFNRSIASIRPDPMNARRAMAALFDQDRECLTRMKASNAQLRASAKDRNFKLVDLKGRARTGADAERYISDVDAVLDAALAASSQWNAVIDQTLLSLLTDTKVREAIALRRSPRPQYRVVLARPAQRPASERALSAPVSQPTPISGPPAVDTGGAQVATDDPLPEQRRTEAPTTVQEPVLEQESPIHVVGRPAEDENPQELRVASATPGDPAAPVLRQVYEEKFASTKLPQLRWLGNMGMGFR